MLGSSCYSSDQCPSMFHCVEDTCVHDDIFPLSAQTILIYAAMGILAGFSNVAGNSMGNYKVPILMLLLSYDLDQATGLAQATVVGAALPNFMSIILKKHPNGLTSLVNYKLVALIIPCSLLGSLLGSIAQTLIPKIVQFCLLVIIFSYFVYNFIQKLRKLKDVTSQEPRVLYSTLIDSADTIDRSSSKQISQEKQQLMDYEKSFHIKQIFLSFCVFLVFQSLVFLVQGKLPFYKIQKCSVYYPLGLGFILIVIISYLFVVRKIMKRVYALYRKHQIHQQIYLDGRKEFFSVIGGGLMGGTAQGILGMGSGNCIMIVLYSFSINPRVVSATSGYQILFTGAGSLLAYYINGRVKVVESLWMMGVCSVIGGAITVCLYQILKRLDQLKVNRFLIVIILCLCMMSLGLTGPTVKRILDKQGWNGMISTSFKC